MDKSLVGREGKRKTEADGGFVRVRGAREHNLKDVSLEIPRNSLVVFTGISGSGKSSLAFGTLYAEAQRRYLESVSPYARRLFHQMAVPEVDSGRWAASGGGAAAAARLADHPILGRQRDHVVEFVADALLARRRLSEEAAAPIREVVLAEHAGRRLPELPRRRSRARGERTLLGARRRSDHQRARGGRLADSLAGPEPARHPRYAWLRRGSAVARATEKGPRLDPVHG